MKIDKINPISLVIVLFVLKMLALGVEQQEVLLLFVVFIGLLADRVISYLYPKRPDVYLELHNIKQELLELKTKTEEQDHDLTALKMDKGFRVR